MEHVKLGSTGLNVSEICFGTWRFNQRSNGTLEIDHEMAHDLLDVFAEHGGNFIDTAPGYGDTESERWIGEWLDNRDREDYVLESKVYYNVESRFTEDLSRKSIRAEIEGTLDRLGTDYLDVYYIHNWDDDTPIRETLRTLDRLVDEGKVNHIGASGTSAWKLVKGLWTSDVDGLERFEIAQPLFNAAYRPQERLEVYADQDLAVCPFSPLEAGLLTGKYERDADYPEGSRGDLVGWDPEQRFSDAQWRVLDAVKAVAEETDSTPAKVSLRWLMDQREFTCVPIVGARTTDQLEENLGAVDVSLSDEQYDRIDEAIHD
jgi:aryl-alcohol dehydrogenase-like predicted oxidoreductase